MKARFIVRPESLIIHADRLSRKNEQVDQYQELNRIYRDAYKVWDRFGELPYKKFNTIKIEKNRLEVKKMDVDISQELADLWKVYSSAFENIKSTEEAHLRMLVVHMKRFVDVFEDKITMKNKMDDLRMKMQVMGSDCEDCDEDEGDDE